MARNENWVDNFIKNLPEFEGVALDIGANHGIYTKLLASKFQTVYAFEPHPDNVARISANVSSPNVVVEQKVVGTSDGKSTLFVCRSNDGGHTIMEGLAEHSKWGHTKDNYIDVESVTLDTFCEGKSVKFIKCDIEGGEYEIFYSGEQMLKDNSPMIVLETHQVSNFEDDQMKRDKLYSYFKDLGYYTLNTNGDEVTSFTYDTHYLLGK
jgi:FkbM family methyltransferase